MAYAGGLFSVWSWSGDPVLKGDLGSSRHTLPLRNGGTSTFTLVFALHKEALPTAIQQQLASKPYIFPYEGSAFPSWCQPHPIRPPLRPDSSLPHSRDCKWAVASGIAVKSHCAGNTGACAEPWPASRARRALRVSTVHARPYTPSTPTPSPRHPTSSHVICDSTRARRRQVADLTTILRGLLSQRQWAQELRSDHNQ